MKTGHVEYRDKENEKYRINRVKKPIGRVLIGKFKNFLSSLEDFGIFFHYEKN